MLHARLMVAVLRAIEHVDAVERRPAAIAVQHRVHVRPRQLRTGLKRELDEVTVAPLTRFDRADVKRRQRLALHAGVMQGRAVFENHFGDSVREIHHVIERDITLDHTCLRVTLHDDHMARMRHHASATRIGDMQQMHRCFRHHLLGDVNHRAFAGKRGVQCSEAIAIGGRGAAQVALQQLGLINGGLRQRHHPHALRQRDVRRQRRREAAIQKHQHRPRAAKRKGFQTRSIGRHTRCAIGRRDKTGFGDG